MNDELKMKLKLELTATLLGRKVFFFLPSFFRLNDCCVESSKSDNLFSCILSLLENQKTETKPKSKRVRERPKITERKEEEKEEKRNTNQELEKTALKTQPKDRKTNTRTTTTTTTNTQNPLLLPLSLLSLSGQHKTKHSPGLRVEDERK